MDLEILTRRTHENARSYAIRTLLHNIIQLQLPPGSAVSENELSAALTLSRTPVREALIELSRMGLVEIFPQKGSYITKINYDLVEESHFMRLTMEEAVLKQACKQGLSASYLNALEENLASYRSCMHTNYAEKCLEIDNAFHQIIFESVHKTWTYRILQEQMIHFDRVRALSLKSVTTDYILRDHEDILYALRRQDTEMASMLIHRHLNRHQMEKEELLKKYPGYFIN